MATESKHVVDRIKDLTLCGICADTLTDARVLPCLHTFCLDCLRLAGAELRPYQSMPCPICRSEFRVPRQDFSALPKNFLMENLLEISSLPSPSSESFEVRDPEGHDGDLQRPCDVCSETGSDATPEVEEPEVDRSGGATSSAPAVVYCVDCRQSLCRLCRNHHRRLPATRRHRFSDEPEVVENFRKSASDNVGAAMAWIDEGTRKRERIAEARTRYENEVLRAESDVIRVRDDAKRVIDSRAELLLGELSLAKRMHLDGFRNDLDRIDCHLAIVESFMNRCLNAKDAVADDVICRIGDDLNATADDLRSIHRTHLDEQVTDAHVTVQSTDFDEFLERRQRENAEDVTKSKTEIVDESLDFSFSSESLKKKLRKNSVAVVVVMTSIVLAIFLNSYIPKVRLVSLQLATRLHESHSVMGVTYMDDHIFVISRSTRSIFVYEGREPFDLVKEIPVPQVKSPWDVVGAPRSNSLYISDRENACIWSLSLREVAKEGWFSGTGYEYPLTLWLTGITEPYTLSISRDGGVLLLRGGASPRLEKYLPGAAVLERSVALPPEAEDPRHLLETSAGNFVVSYGWSGTRRQGVVELDPDGHVVRTQDPLYEWQRLKNPYHMAMDADDRLFVADFYNSRLLLLVANGNGWDTRTVLDEAGSGVVKPHRLALGGGGGGDRHRLLILVHDDGQTVDVYNVTQSP